MSLEALLLDTSEEVLLLLDAQTLEIVCANRAAYACLDYAPGQLVGKPIGELECALTDIFFWDEMRASSQAMQTQGSFMKADGAILDVMKSVRRVGADGCYFAVSARPLDETPEAANAYSDISSHLIATLEATADAILLTDIDGAILNMNHRFAALWQVPRQLLLDRDDAGIMAHMGSLLASHSGPSLQNHAARMADDTSQDRFDVLELGDGRVIECISHPARTGERFIGRVFCYRDVTERRVHEQSLQEARNRAELATRSKGQFLANMSHEIRTPMNAVLGLLNLLQSTELTRRQRDYSSKAEGAARSLLGLLNDILDYSKVEAGKMTLELQPFRIDRMLRSLSVVLSATVGAKEIELLVDVDPALPEVLLGDAMRLQQVLTNIGGNAVKFTEEGQVVLALRQTGATEDAVTVEFSVQDSGIGIAAGNQAQIFSGFTQAEASTTRLFGGTGLGLAISKRFVELMGGDIQIDSTLGVGTTFSFALQLARVQDVPAELQAPARAPVQAGQVLVVDDNPVAADISLRMVHALGWQGQLAQGGAQALEMVSAAHAQSPSTFAFPVIFMDWKMPGMDGWEATRHIRQFALLHQLAQPTIIMLTAHGRDDLGQRAEAEQDMINGYLVKPVTASMLLDAVLEAASDPAAARAVAKGRSNRKQLAGMRILVVEDNLINQQVADELLSAEGAIVSLAANGQLGVEAVAAAAPQFDAVLMDIQMPVLDGYGATQVIREGLGLKQLPIIAMTANAMASDRAACLAGGMDEHIGKPFDMATLVAALIRLTGLQTAPHTMVSDAAQAPPVPALPRIAGLDVATALARMSGMRSLYVRTARDFSRVLDTSAAELQSSLLAGGQAKAALMLLHTLKGNAATLGASALAGMAATLEGYCKSGRPQQCLDALAQLDAVITSTQAQLAEAIAELATADTPAPSVVEGQTGHAAVTRALRELEGLTQSSDMDALERATELRAVLHALPDGFYDRLDEALQNLDLASAHTLCSDMLASMSAEMKLPAS